MFLNWITCDYCSSHILSNTCLGSLMELNLLSKLICSFQTSFSHRRQKLFSGFCCHLYCKISLFVLFTGIFLCSTRNVYWYRLQSLSYSVFSFTFCPYKFHSLNTAFIFHHYYYILFEFLSVRNIWFGVYLSVINVRNSHYSSLIWLLNPGPLP